MGHPPKSAIILSNIFALVSCYSQVPEMMTVLSVDNLITRKIPQRIPSLSVVIDVPMTLYSITIN